MPASSSGRLCAALAQMGRAATAFAELRETAAAAISTFHGTRQARAVNHITAATDYAAQE